MFIFDDLNCPIWCKREGMLYGSVCVMKEGIDGNDMSRIKITIEVKREEI